MTGRWMQLVVAFLIGLVGPPVVHGDDLEEIRSSFEAEVEALNALDRNAFVTPAH